MRETGVEAARPEHILLGLLREEEGIAAYVLGGLGLTVEEVRRGVVGIVGSGEQLISGQIGSPDRWMESAEPSSMGRFWLAPVRLAEQWRAVVLRGHLQAASRR